MYETKDKIKPEKFQHELGSTCMRYTYIHGGKHTHMHTRKIKIKYQIIFPFRVEETIELSNDHIHPSTKEYSG